MASRDTCEAIFVSKMHLVCLRSSGSDREEVRCAGPVVGSALEGASVWRGVLRIVSSPPPSGIEVSTAGSARGVDRDRVPGDRIKNGHAAVLSRSGTGGTRHAWSGSASIVGVVTPLLTHSGTGVSIAKRGGPFVPHPLWRRGLIPEPDPPKDRHPSAVNSPLTGSRLSPFSMVSGPLTSW
jgi:hypothetical protein